MSRYLDDIIDSYNATATELGINIATQLNQSLDMNLSKLFFGITDKHYAIGTFTDGKHVSVELDITITVSDDGNIIGSATSKHWQGELPIIFNGELQGLYKDLKLGAMLHHQYNKVIVMPLKTLTTLGEL